MSFLEGRRAELDRFYDVRIKIGSISSSLGGYRFRREFPLASDINELRRLTDEEQRLRLSLGLRLPPPQFPEELIHKRTLKLVIRIFSLRRSLDELRKIEVKRGTKCVHCKSSTAIEMDHIIPKFMGGVSHPGNLQPLCRKCHEGKTRQDSLKWRFQVRCRQRVLNTYSWRYPMWFRSTIPQRVQLDHLERKLVRILRAIQSGKARTESTSQ